MAAANAAAAAAGPLSPEALQAAVTEEMQRLVAKEGTARSPELEGVITEQMVRARRRAGGAHACVASCLWGNGVAHG